MKHVRLTTQMPIKKPGLIQASWLAEITWVKYVISITTEDVDQALGDKFGQPCAQRGRRNTLCPLDYLIDSRESIDTYQRLQLRQPKRRPRLAQFALPFFVSSRIAVSSSVADCCFIGTSI